MEPDLHFGCASVGPLDGGSPLCVPSYWPPDGDGTPRLGLSAQFEGSRSAGEIQRFWQNWEHPSINKQEWSRQEVGQLKAIAAQHGHLEWQKIAEELGVRSGPAETLRPGSVRGPRFGAFTGCVTAQPRPSL